MGPYRLLLLAGLRQREVSRVRDIEVKRGWSILIEFKFLAESVNVPKRQRMTTTTTTTFSSNGNFGEKGYSKPRSSTFTLFYGLAKKISVFGCERFTVTAFDAYTHSAYSADIHSVSLSTILHGRFPYIDGCRR